MAIEDTTPNAGAGEAAPAQNQPAPKSDAAAAAQAAQASEAAAAPNAEEAAKAAADAQEAERKKNRTSAYIERLRRENAELRAYRQSQGQQAPQQYQQPQQQRTQPSADTGPTLEEHNFDLAAWQRANTAWVLEQARTSLRTEHEQQSAQQREQELWGTYESRAAAFAEAHPDFEEVVGSIAYPLTQEVQAAIAALPNGAEIAYHIGNNDDEAFALASIQPHLAAAAVQRLAARLGAAPSQSAAAPAAQAAPPPKPISQTPPPPPSLGGRAPSETPAEKLTDDEWYERQRAQRAKK
jgi:hypothetical protein